MSSYLSYGDAYKVLKKAGADYVSMIDNSVKSMGEFVEFCRESAKSLGSIKYALPTAKKKKIFEREKGPKAFAGMEPAFSAIWGKLVEGYLNHPKSMTDMCDLIQSDLIAPMKDLRRYYVNSMDEIECTVKNTMSSFAEEEEQYTKSINKYRSDCTNIQSCYDTLRRGENEKTRDKYMELKNNYKNMQLETIDEIRKFNMIQSKYVLAMEEAILDFEKLDNVRDKKMLDIFNSVLPKIEQISKECETSADDIDGIIQGINGEEANALLAGNESLNNQEIVSVRFKPITLSVKLKEIQPSVIFERELKCFRAIAKNKVDSDQIKLEVGDMVKVVKIKGSQWEVIDLDRNCMGVVNSTDFIEKPELKPKLAKLIANVFSDDKTIFNAEEGETVLVEYVIGEDAFCSDVFGRKGIAPLKALSF